MTMADTRDKLALRVGRLIVRTAPREHRGATGAETHRRVAVAADAVQAVWAHLAEMGPSVPAEPAKPKPAKGGKPKPAAKVEGDAT